VFFQGGLVSEQSCQESGKMLIQLGGM
jgi:hypothetical protein